MRKFASFIAIAAMILAVAACKKEDQPGGGKVSDLQYLIEALMRTDENGKITGYMIGDNLNPADPYDISVPVDSYEEAVELFFELMPEGAHYTQDATSVTWDMTDGDGKPEGKAILRKNEELGAVATISVTPLLMTKGAKVFPSVTFLPPILWPENGGAAEEILNRDYYVGAVVWKEKDEGFSNGEFLVIREWTPKESGLMVQMLNHKLSSGKVQGDSSIKTLHRVHKALMANYDLLVNGYWKEQNWPSLDKWYVSQTTTWYGDTGYLNMLTGKEKWSWLDISVSECYLIYVYCFKPDGDKIKFW